MAMQHIFFASTARSSSTLRCHSFLGVVGGVWAGACGGWALVLHHGDEVDDLLDGPVGEHLLVRDAGAGLQVLVRNQAVVVVEVVVQAVHGVADQQQELVVFGEPQDQLVHPLGVEALQAGQGAEAETLRDERRLGARGTGELAVFVDAHGRQLVADVDEGQVQPGQILALLEVDVVAESGGGRGVASGLGVLLAALAQVAQAQDEHDGQNGAAGDEPRNGCHDSTFLSSLLDGCPSLMEECVFCNTA